LQPIDFTSENRTKKTVLGIISDARWPGMYRLRFADAHLSDMVNLTRAKDAVANAILAQQLKTTAPARSRAA